jgi:phosphotransferase system HPr (HPr) family protein
VDAERTVRIVNRSGLHARPCHALVTRALLYKSDLRVACGPREVNGKSILELMTLSAPCEAELHFKARGEDAGALIDDLSALVESGFQEE